MLNSAHPCPGKSSSQRGSHQNTMNVQKCLWKCICQRRRMRDWLQLFSGLLMYPWIWNLRRWLRYHGRLVHSGTHQWQLSWAVLYRASDDSTIYLHWMNTYRNLRAHSVWERTYQNSRLSGFLCQAVLCASIFWCIQNRNAMSFVVVLDVFEDKIIFQ